MLLFLIFAVIGLVAGLMSGLLGIGGGIVTVPSFLFAFYLFDFPEEYGMHVAVGTSLGVMVLTASSSTLAHFLKKGIQWNYLRYYSPGVIGGVVVGAMIADSLPNRQLVALFSGYIFCFGIYFILTACKKGNPYAVEKGLKEPYAVTTGSVGFLMGIVSSVLGVGGAPITVPFLTSHRVSLSHAISTSAFVTLIVGTMGSLSYLYFGLNEPLKNGNIGYLYLPAVFITGIASVVSAPLGAILAYKLPTRVLRGFFGVFLVIVSFTLYR